ncbi:MAG TPA: FtsX-like permease family protein, partial [Gaiellaceae bacterium]|nr:FtsX-like permease family protein [Gaiellaceae bacterium]
PTVHLRIAGVYRALDADFQNPYWANWVQEISTRNPNDSPLPTFVLMPERTFLHVAKALNQRYVENRFEYPVDPTNITYVDAEHLAHTYDQLGRELAPKQTGSSISAALLIADRQVGELATTIALLSAAALAIAALVAAAAGVFLVRRRIDEVQLLFARGEAPWSFALRTSVEALLPGVIGLGAGYGGAIAALTLFAPAGTLDHGTVVAGAFHSLAAAAAAVALLALVACASFPRLPHKTRFGRLRVVPWEIVPLAAAGALVGLLLSGSALAKDAHGNSHPRLVVFLLPAVAAAALAGLAARATRRATHRRGTDTALSLFLLLRRIAAARGLLIAVAVSATTAFAVYGYAQTLSSSLQRSAAEKAYIGNGSDAQGLIDPTERIYDPFPFPATTAQVDSTEVTVQDGQGVVVVAGDPAELAKVLIWGNWPDDPRTRLPKLARATAPPGVLPVIASPDFPSVKSIDDQGVSIPVRVVARAPIPGAIGGWPAVLVDAKRFHAVAKFHHVADPGPAAGAVIWARGDPRVLEPALARSNLRPSFLTTLSFIRDNQSVVAAARSYRYLRAIGIAAIVLALASLLLYLQARQREQRLASALLRRMGVPAWTDVVTLALEASAIAGAACIGGELVAIGAARLVVPHVDPLPQYAPGTAVVFPWTTLLWVCAVAAVVAATFGAVAVALARRGSVAEELRVA